MFFFLFMWVAKCISQSTLSVLAASSILCGFLLQEVQIVYFFVTLSVICYLWLYYLFGFIDLMVGYYVTGMPVNVICTTGLLMRTTRRYREGHSSPGQRGVPLFVCALGGTPGSRLMIQKMSLVERYLFNTATRTSLQV